MSDELPLTKICEYDGCRQKFTQGHRTKYRFERMRFCSQDCGRRGTVAGPSRSEFCQRGLHAMDDDNVRVNTRGRRSCKACQADARSSGPDIVPVSQVPGWEPREPWRPAGWSPTPNVRSSS